MGDTEQKTPAVSAASSVREFIVPVLTLVIGVFVLLPTAIGPIGRPFSLSWLLPVFIGLAVVSSIGLALALLASNWTIQSAQTILHIGHGIGNLMGALSLLAAAAFLCWNYLEDANGLPRIVNVKINPVQPEAGKMVEIELEVSNRAGIPLAFDWEFDGKAIAGLRTAYIKMPAKAGSYAAVATVRPLSDSPSRAGTDHKASGGKDPPANDRTSVRVTLDVWAAEKSSSALTEDKPQDGVHTSRQEKSNGATTKTGNHRSGASKPTAQTPKSLR